MNLGAFAKGMFIMFGIAVLLISLFGFLSGLVASAIGGTTGAIIVTAVTAAIVFVVAACWPGKEESQGDRYWIAGIFAAGTIVGVYVSQQFSGLWGIWVGAIAAGYADAMLFVCWIFLVPKEK